MKPFTYTHPLKIWWWSLMADWSTYWLVHHRVELTTMIVQREKYQGLIVRALRENLTVAEKP
jgi:hypothetical protein